MGSRRMERDEQGPDRAVAGDVGRRELEERRGVSGRGDHVGDPTPCWRHEVRASSVALSSPFNTASSSDARHVAARPAPNVTARNQALSS